jgi:hypothetical protein
MKSILLFLITVFLFATPTIAHADFEQYIEKVHYNHINRTEGSQTLETKKETGNVNSPTINVYIWGTLSEKYTQKFYFEILPILKNNYPQAKFTYLHRSFSFHEPTATEIEKQVECTAEQNVFWQNIQLVSARKSNEIKTLNQTQFKNCLNKPANKALLETANEDGASLGINSIPTVIIENAINSEVYDVKITGAQELAVFEEGFSQVLSSPQFQTTSVEKKIAELEERVASAESEVSILKSEQSFIQTQIDKLLILIESLLQNVKLV